MKLAALIAIVSMMLMGKGASSEEFVVVPEFHRQGASVFASLRGQTELWNSPYSAKVVTEDEAIGTCYISSNYTDGYEIRIGIIAPQGDIHIVFTRNNSAFFLKGGDYDVEVALGYGNILPSAESRLWTSVAKSKVDRLVSRADLIVRSGFLPELASATTMQVSIDGRRLGVFEIQGIGSALKALRRCRGDA